MKATTHYAYYICTLILLAMWIPVSLDKILHFELFKSAMIQQPFNDRLGVMLAYMLPFLEVITALFFLFKKYRIVGFYLSSLLMIIFTTYVAVALLGKPENLPCGCGLVFQHLSWEVHLILNGIFLLISLIGLQLEKLISRRNTRDLHSAKNISNDINLPKKNLGF